MEVDTYIQTRLEYEKRRLTNDNNPSAKERAQTWISTIENAPLSIEKIQTLMDAKEIAMNKVSDIAELQQLDRELSALEWLQGVIRKARKEQTKQI
jgi:hypothetical protein